MVKKIISLYIEEDTIKKMDEMASAFDNNRSTFIDWLAVFDFFIESGKLQQIKTITEAKRKIAELRERKQKPKPED